MSKAQFLTVFPGAVSGMKRSYYLTYGFSVNQGEEHYVPQLLKGNRSSHSNISDPDDHELFSLLSIIVFLNYQEKHTVGYIYIWIYQEAKYSPF